MLIRSWEGCHGRGAAQGEDGEKYEDARSGSVRAQASRIGRRGALPLPCPHIAERSRAWERAGLPLCTLSVSRFWLGSGFPVSSQSALRRCSPVPPASRPQYAGSSAFKSSTKRGKDSELNYMGDPGAYDAHSQTELASSSKKSFGKTYQAGTGGFGSTAKARQELSQPGDAPGPGAYEPKEPQKPEAKQQSSFASKTLRGAYAKSSDAPGVGSYEPVPVQEAVLGGQSAFKSGGSRFKRDSALEAAAHVGPGSYTFNNNSIEERISQSASKAAVPFQTSTKRPDMALPSDTPGPGAYNESSRPNDSRPSSAFKSSTKRGKDSELNYMGDPGAYDAHSQTELASSSKKSFGKTYQAGTGGFGSTAKARQELSQPGDAPGPGAYEPKEPQKPEAKQQSSFASKTLRGAYAKSSDAPGVGSYEPVPVQEAVLGGQSAFKSGGSRFKRDSALEAAAHIGPGSYKFENNTITSQVNADQGKVSSSFASMTLRDGFLGV